MGTACATTGTAATGGVRTVVVLTADQATEIVVPAGFATATTSIATPVSSQRTASDAGTSSLDTTSSSAAPASSSEEPASETSIGGADNDELLEEATDQTPGQGAITASTVATTTTAGVVAKETIPLAEEDRVPPGVRLMSALDDFNACLAEEGHEWIGFPDAAQGAEALVNQPSYLEALQLCNSRTGISDAYQDFETSRSDLSPEDIRQENEDFIDLVDCLRRVGWTVSDLRPDELGLLNPGDEFAGPDGGFVTDDIRDCASEIALAREDEE